MAWALVRRRSRTTGFAIGLLGAAALTIGPAVASSAKMQTLIVAVCTTALILGGAYVGVGSVLAWAARRVIRELTALGPMIARTLPLFTLASLFLFYNAEIWQVMKPLPWSRIVAVGAVLALLTLFLVVVTTRDEMKEIIAAHDSIHSTPLHKAERFNVVLVPSLVTCIQTVLFAALVFIFFCLFGLLSVSDTTIAQ